VKAMFNQVEVIVGYNEKISAELQERVSKWVWTSQLGDMFLEMMDFLKTYIQFVNNYNYALQTLDKLKKIPEFVAWLSKTERKPELNGNTLESLLIMPIQRIPRYVLLIEDLNKHTPEDHIDHAKLTEALGRMKTIAKLINEKKGEAESFVKVVDIYNRLEPKIEDLCAAHRQFIREGYLKEDEDIYMFYLFSDILLKTKEKKERNILKMKAHITLMTADIMDVPDDKKLKNSFQIVTPRKTILLSARSSEEKSEWLKELIDCKQTLTKKSMSYANLLKSGSGSNPGSRIADRQSSPRSTS